MTKEERKLWYTFFKKLPVTVNRQKVIGTYIVDFYIAEKKIAIEIDGSGHYFTQAEEKDKKRDAFLHEQGIRVLRYTNLEIARNFKSVCADIYQYLQGEKK